jgi:hypothetical protein
MGLMDWIPPNVKRAIRKEVWLTYIPKMVKDVEASIDKKINSTKYDKHSLTQLVFFNTLA